MPPCPAPSQQKLPPSPPPLLLQEPLVNPLPPSCARVGNGMGMAHHRPGQPAGVAELLPPKRAGGRTPAAWVATGRAAGRGCPRNLCPPASSIGNAAASRGEQPVQQGAAQRAQAGHRPLKALPRLCPSLVLGRAVDQSPYRLQERRRTRYCAAVHACRTVPMHVRTTYTHTHTKQIRP